MLTGSLAIPPLKETKIKPGRSASRHWVVVKDPSGDFLGRTFRTYDLNGARENYWPEGIVFENQRTGERKAWRRGQFVKPLDGVTL